MNVTYILLGYPAVYLTSGRSCTAKELLKGFSFFAGPPPVKVEEINFPVSVPAPQLTLAPPATVQAGPAARGDFRRCDLGRGRQAKVGRDTAGPGSPEPREVPCGPLGPRALRGGAPRGRGTTRGGARRTRKTRRRSGSESDRDSTPRGEMKNACSAAVGCRVGIYWRDDDAYYKVGFGRALLRDGLMRERKGGCERGTRVCVCVCVEDRGRDRAREKREWRDAVIVAWVERERQREERERREGKHDMNTGGHL